MNWAEALKAYYVKHKPARYLPKKGTEHYKGVKALMCKTNTTTTTKRKPAKKTAKKTVKKTVKKTAKKKVRKPVLTKSQCQKLKSQLNKLL